MRRSAGETVEYTVTHLEMTDRPRDPRPHLPSGPVSALVAAEKPPVWYFLSLYDAVGAEYEWTDQHEKAESELRAFLHDPSVTLFTLMRTGWPDMRHLDQFDRVGRDSLPCNLLKRFRTYRSE